MRRALGFVAAAAAVCIVPSAVWGQAAAPTPHQVELARQIIDASGQRQYMVGMMQSAARQTIENAAKDLPPDKQASSKAAADALSVVYARLAPRMLDVAADAYARTYSEDELSQILAFMRSPTGRAMSAKAPQVMQKVVAGMVTLMPEVRREYATELCARTDCPPQLKALAGSEAPTKP